MIDWLPWAALAVGLACGVAIILLGHHGRARPEPGAPGPVIPIDDTPVQDEPQGNALVMCPHGIPLNRACEACEGVLRGKHITLDGEPESAETAVIPEPPRAPPPPPVSGVIGRMRPPGPKGAA